MGSSNSDCIKKIMFGENIVDFDEVGFKGTRKEYRIFEEVFFRKSMGNAKANTSRENVNLRTSALISFQENSSCCAQCGISCRDLLTLQEMFSGLKLNHQENEVQELNNSNLSLHAHSKTSESVTVLFDKQKGSVNVAEPIVNNEGVNNVYEIEHKGVKVANELESVVPLISEAKIAAKETSNATICINQCLGDPISIANSNTNGRKNKPLRREVHSRVESCAHCLLIDAGWIIDARQRTERTKPAYSFRNLEEGLNCKTLTLAWMSCGKKLLASASESERDGNGREWYGIDSFMKDMDTTLDYIGKEMLQGSSISLLKRWQLLDPFMTVVWIDKKLSVLRAGNGLKAVNSRTFITHEIENRVDINDGEVSTSSGMKRKKPYNPRSKLTSMQKEASCLEEHRHITGTETVNLVMADNSGENTMQSEMLSPDQAFKHEVNDVANTDCSLSCKLVYKKSTSPQQESSGIAVKMTNPKKYKSKLKRAAVNDSAEKTPKKSRKISDCNATGTDYSASDMTDKETNVISGPNSECLQNLPVEESDNLADNSLSKESEKLEVLTRKIVKNINNKNEEAGCNDSETKKPSPNESTSMDSNKPELAHDQCIDPRVTEFVNGKYDPKKTEDEGECDDALINTSNASCDKSVIRRKSKGKKPYRSRFNDDDLLISLILKSKCRKGRIKKFSSKTKTGQLKESRKSKNQTANRTLLPRLYKKEEINSLGERTILSWLIESGALSVKDVLQFRNLENDEVVKDGRVTLKGILCKCCAKIFSVSEFMAHADVKQQKLSLNLYLKSGKTYTDCQLQAWSAEYKRRKGSIRIIGDDEKAEGDDTCGICGDVGDLICCDRCPSTYHKSCLSIKEIPEGNWYCSYCICMICNYPIHENETSNSSGTLECSQCQLKYHGACIKEKVGWYGKLGSSAWFCGKSCRKVFSGLRSLVGMVTHIDDKHSWTVLRCNHGSRKFGSAEEVALMAECNTKLAISLSLMEECFLPMVDPKTGISMIPHVLYNFGSPFARLNYQGFYTVVLEKGDVLVSVATIRVHGAEVAEMPLVVSCYQYRRQGMCRLLLNAVEKMLIFLKVKMLLVSAIPSLVETWVSSFGFKPVEAEDRKQLAKINLMPFPDTILLKKKLVDASAPQSDAVGSTDHGSSEQQSPECNESIETVSGVAINQATENDEVSTEDEENNGFVQTEASFCAEQDFPNNNELGSSKKNSNSKEKNHVLLTSQKISTPDESGAVDPEDKTAQNITIDNLHEKNAESLPNGDADKDEMNEACHATTCNMEGKTSEKSIFLLRVVKGVYLS